MFKMESFKIFTFPSFTPFQVLRKALITLFFWFMVCIGALSAFINIIINMTYDHDSITHSIEHNMASFIFDAMVITKIWKVTIVYRPDKSSGNDDTDEKISQEINSNINRILDAKTSYILAANHNSILDTLFIALLPFKKTYTFNKKWGFVPVFGWMALMADYISIDKSSPEKLKEIVPQVVKRVNDGYSVMIYPEGTRNQTVGKLSDNLKTGAFRVAQITNKPILPIALINTNKAMSYYGVADIANIEIQLLDPIYVTEEENGVESAMNLYREQINQILARCH